MQFGMPSGGCDGYHSAQRVTHEHDTLETERSDQSGDVVSEVGNAETFLAGQRRAVAAQIGDDQAASREVWREQEKAPARIREPVDQQQRGLGPFDIDICRPHISGIDEALASCPSVLIRQAHRPSFSLTASRPGLPSKVVTPTSHASSRCGFAFIAFAPASVGCMPSLMR